MQSEYGQIETEYLGLLHSVTLKKDLEFILGKNVPPLAEQTFSETREDWTPETIRRVADGEIR